VTGCRYSEGGPSIVRPELIIIIIIISFMQRIYTHIPETNYVPREFGVAAILSLLLLLLLLVSRLRMSGGVPLLSPYTFLMWTGTTSRCTFCVLLLCFC